MTKEIMVTLLIQEYCEKNNYDIVDVYNDAGHSGKD